MSAIPHTTLGLPVPTKELVAALRKHRGKIAPAARELSCSRAYIHEQIADLGMAEEVRQMRTIQPKDMLAALAAVQVDQDEVALRVMEGKSPRAATLTVLVETIAKLTRYPKREVAAELSKPRYSEKLGALLPAPESGDDVPKKAMQVSIRHDQRAWLGTKPRGTAPVLLSSVEDWPEVEAQTPANLYHTSFYIPVAVADSIAARAEEVGCSISAVVRAVLDRAIADDAPTSAAA